MGRRSNATTMACLTASICALAAAAVWVGKASWLEAVSFVTGAICVWLTVRESVWNFPIGLANVATFSVVFFRAHLFADAALQVVYFILGCLGWWMWAYGGMGRGPLKVSRSGARELTAVTLFVVVATVAMWQLLREWGGPASFWDALTTAMSLASQWLLNRKRLESWIGWIAVDLVYVPLYFAKELYLTAILYAIFCVMATMGLRAWRESWRTVQRETSMEASTGVAIA